MESILSLCSILAILEESTELYLLLFLGKVAVLNQCWCVFWVSRISLHFIKQKAKNINKGTQQPEISAR